MQWGLCGTACCRLNKTDAHNATLGLSPKEQLPSWGFSKDHPCTGKCTNEYRHNAQSCLHAVWCSSGQLLRKRPGTPHQPGVHHHTGTTQLCQRKKIVSNQNAEAYKQASSLVPNQLHQVSSGACHSPAGNTMAKPWLGTKERNATDTHIPVNHPVTLGCAR